MESVVIPVVVLGSMGLSMGVFLAYASKKFEIILDPKIEKIIKILPGINCGGCGYPGCNGYAVAVVEDGVSRKLCAPGRAKVVEAIDEIMNAKDEAVPAVAAKDGVSKEETKKEELKKEEIKKDKVSKDEVAKEELKKDKVAKDKVAKDEAVPAVAAKDGVSKEETKKEEIKKEELKKDKVSKDEVAKEELKNKDTEKKEIKSDIKEKELKTEETKKEETKKEENKIEETTKNNLKINLNPEIKNDNFNKTE